MRTFANEAWDQVFLLALFSGANEPLDNLKIQKVVFLTEEEARKQKLIAAHFPFFRNKFGPYSPLLANTVRKLEDCCFIYPETRQPTKRGQYILDYVADDIEESKSAHWSIDLLRSIREKYAKTGSFELKDIVYEIKVPVSGLRGDVMKVKDIPMRTTIIHPALERLSEEPTLPEDLLDDLYVEFSLRNEDLDPDNPANVKLAREAIAAALA